MEKYKNLHVVLLLPPQSHFTVENKSTLSIFHLTIQSIITMKFTTAFLAMVTILTPLTTAAPAGFEDITVRIPAGIVKRDTGAADDIVCFGVCQNNVGIPLSSRVS
jgi:hypothetical protein